MENFENLQKLFDYLDSDIRYFHLRHKGDGVKKEAIVRRRAALRELVEKIRLNDLSVIFYLKNIERINATALRQTLEKEYRAQCERKNILRNTDEFFDPLRLENN